jgi:hypothetical protein
VCVCVCVCAQTHIHIYTIYIYAGGEDAKRSGGLDLRGYREEELEGDVTLWRLSKEDFDTIKRQYPGLDGKIRNNTTVQMRHAKCMVASDVTVCRWDMTKNQTATRSQVNEVINEAASTSSQVCV